MLRTKYKLKLYMQKKLQQYKKNSQLGNNIQAKTKIDWRTKIALMSAYNLVNFLTYHTTYKLSAIICKLYGMHFAL